MTNKELNQKSDISELLDKTESIFQEKDFKKIREAYLMIKNSFDDSIQKIEAYYLNVKNQQDEDEDISDEKYKEIEPHTKEIEELKNRFINLKNTYSKLRLENQKEVLETQSANLETKKSILQELQKLIDSDDNLQNSFEQLHNLQNRWREIGAVSRNENNNLWNEYNFLVERFLDKVQIYKELKDLDNKKNMEAKIEICEKIEQLLLESSITESFNKFKEYQSRWREVGPVPPDKRDEINDRFMLAVEKLKQKRKDHYENFKKQQEDNLEVKNALITRIKNINETEYASIKDWQKKTAETEELFQLWKSTGNVPKKDNERVWEEFKKEINIFDENKKNYFDILKDEQLENYNKKLHLCRQAETIQDSTDWKHTTEELIKLQQEWKITGHVPKRYSETLWQRFRKACVTFFDKKQDYFSNISKHEEENLKKKQEIVEQLKKLEFSDNKEDNFNKIKELQRDYLEVGRVPVKEKDNIYNRYKETLNKLFDKFKLTEKDKIKFEVKSQYEDMTTTDAGIQEIKKEIFAVNKITDKIETDLQLWENNIEFFNKSKNSELLTQEFRKKIEKAKADLVINKEKIKALNILLGVNKVKK